MTILKLEEPEGKQSLENFAVIEGGEEYISMEEDGYRVDGERLYARAAAEGLADEQIMLLSVEHNRRLSLFVPATLSNAVAFTVGELKIGEVFLPLDEIENDWLVRLYKVL